MRDLLFAPITGDIVIYLRNSLPVEGIDYTTDVLVRAQLPASSSYQQRMVTIRDDGGRDEGPLSRRSISVNVWAETRANADLLSQYLMALLRSMPDGEPIVATQTFAGPFEVIDQNTGKIVVDEVTLSQYFFTFEAVQRGQNL